MRRAWTLPREAKDPPKGAWLSPDGSCVLTLVGREARIYDATLPVSSNSDTEAQGHQAQVLTREGEPIYDASWFPAMDSSRPETCAFATTSKGSPVHLWDAYASHALRASYPLVDEGGEPLGKSPAVWLGVDTVRTGTERGVVVEHDLERPGTAPSRYWYFGGRAMVSSVASSSPEKRSWFVVGSLSGHVWVVDPRAGPRGRGVQLAQMQGQRSGISRVRCVPDSFVVWTAARRSSELCAWDARVGGHEPLHRLPRDAHSNQRIDFDVDAAGTTLVGGSLPSSSLARKAPAPAQLEAWSLVGGVPRWSGRVAVSSEGGVVNGVSFGGRADAVAWAVGTRETEEAPSWRGVGLLRNLVLV